MTALHIIAMALLIGPVIKQGVIVISHKRGTPDLDTKLMFWVHGIFSFVAIAALAFSCPRPAAWGLLVLGIVSTWVYIIRPLYKH